MPPVTAEELSNALFYMPSNKSLYMVHFCPDESNARNMYINYNRGLRKG